MSTITGAVPSVVALAEQLEGELVLPGEARWDEARQAWNLAADQNPDAVV